MTDINEHYKRLRSITAQIGRLQLARVDIATSCAGVDHKDVVAAIEPLDKIIQSLDEEAGREEQASQLHEVVYMPQTGRKPRKL